MFWSRSARVISIAMFALVASRVARAQGGPGLDPATLVRHAIQNRLNADKTHQPVRYLLHEHDDRRDTTKDIIETKDGDVARLVAQDGKPLTPVADKAELARLANLAAHPELQQHRKRSEQKDAERVNLLMAMLPDSEIYRFEALEPCASGKCFRLSFVPNPTWQPPDMEAKIFRGVEGEVWIDQAQERLTRLEGHFTDDVYIGMGLVGKVYKGGTITLEQTQVAAKDWELTGVHVRITGKAFVVKSVNFHIDEDASQFTPAPAGISYKQAIALLAPGKDSKQ